MPSECADAGITSAADAAQPAGVRIWKDAASSDAFFGRSDNQALFPNLRIPMNITGMLMINWKTELCKMWNGKTM